ncbi:MAG: serine hydrolase domain-containing protein [Myxococcota bacterium]
MSECKLILNHALVSGLVLATACAPSSSTPGRSAFERSLAPQVVPSFVEIPAWSLEQRMKQHRVPGVSVAVFADGDILWAKAYGEADAESGRALTTATVFQAASISKAITAFVVMRLAEQGAVDLDTPVNALLTSWKLPQHKWTQTKPITLRHLLSHMAGLNVSDFPGYAVVQDVTGEDFATTAQRTVFRPLKLENTFVEQPLPARRRASAARGHAGLESKPIDGFSHTYRELAAGGVWSTPSDLAKLALAFTDALQGKGDFLTRESAQAMIEPQFNGKGSLGAFVWSVDDGMMFGHTGGNAGFRNTYYGFVDGRGGAVIMTNSDTGFSLIWEIMASLAKVYGWSYGGAETRPAQRITSETAQAVAGKYVTQLSWIDKLTISIELDDDGGLYVTAPPVLGRTPLYQENDREFFLDTGARFSFQYDEAGRASHLEAELEGGLSATRVQ